MRAVLDTVIILRALANPKGVNGRIFHELSHRYTPIASHATIVELADVSNRPALRILLKGLKNPPSPHEVLALFQGYRIVEPSEELNVCRDPKDNKFFECAVAGDADYIVSEDRDILDVGEFRGIQTITALDFIRLLLAPPDQT